MIGRTVRIALAATAVAVPATSAQAFHHLFKGCCGQPTTAYYAPIAVAAPAPVCCAQPQVVNYVPQTAFRTVYVNAPVMTMQPTTGCDACGRATTVMRPVTTFVMQPRLVPYTTYRVVAAPAQPCCGTPAPITQTFYAPPVAAAPAAPACCASAATTYTPAPALSTYNPAPSAPLATTTPTPMPSLQTVTPGPAAPSPYPSTPTPAPAGENRTFEPSPSDAAPAESRMLLPPRTESSSSTLTRPHGLDSDLEDRTTAIPLRSAYPVRQASLIVPAKSNSQLPDDGGWRAAGR